MITANVWFNTNFEGFRTSKLIPQMAKMRLKEQGIALDKPLLTYVNHGRWLVSCDKCKGAEYAWEEGMFMCRSCWNAGHGHQYRKAEFPEDRQKIEKILEKRALPNRNWSHGETLAFLRQENKEFKAELLEE